MVESIRAVLFDMGGVVVKLDSLATVLGPSTLSEADMWNAWILSPAVKMYERGECDLEHFASSVVAELQLEGTPDDFVDRFVAFPQGLYPGAVEVVASVPKSVVTGVLSNTNALHWENQRDAAAIRYLCDRSYLSYELGMVKPDRAVFDHVVADLDLAPSDVLFIDDNQINVDGARAAGLKSGLAKGPEQATSVLREFGVVS